MSTTNPTRERGSEVQSVLRASNVLAAVVDSQGGLTTTELARQLGLTVSTVHRLAHTLCSGGLLCRDPDTDRFQPGVVLLRLARKALSASGVPEAADVLKRLVDRTGETASLGMRRGDEVLVLLSVPSTRQLRYNGRPGARVPLLSSATGRAILAFHGGQTEEPGDVSSGEQWRTTVDLLAIQYRGYAVYDDPEEPGLRAVAAPVLEPHAQVRLGVEIQGPAERLGEGVLDTIGAEVRAAADALEGLPMSMVFGEL